MIPTSSAVKILSYYLNYQNFTNIPPTVDKIIAGTGIEINPASGQGDVTINSTVSALEFAGNVDVTDETTIPVVRNTNQLFVNIGQGEFHPDWAAITNNASTASEANPGDFMLLDLADTGNDPWTWIEGGSPPASDGLWIEAAGQLSPATLTNDVLVGGADAASAKIQLNADGSAIFGGTVTLNNSSIISFGANADDLVISSGSQPSGGMTFYTSNAGEASINFADGLSSTDVYAGGLAYNHANDSMKFYTNGGQTRLTIASDGNAEFAGGVTFKGDVIITDDTSSSKIGAGYITLQPEDKNFGTTLGNYTEGEYTYQLRADGSASFKGVVAVDREASGNSAFVATLQGEVRTEIQADGSASFAGSVAVGGTLAGVDGATEGTFLSTTGRVYATSTNTGLPVWEGYILNNSTPTSSIDAGGSATFAGDVQVGGNAGITLDRLVFTSSKTDQ